MATETITKLIDDLNGEEAHQTVRFGLDDITYEIDLSDKNATKLREFLGKYIPASRRIRSEKGTRKPYRASHVPAQDTRAVRAWAMQQGYEVSERGRIPADVIAAFDEAHKKSR